MSRISQPRSARSSEWSPQIVAVFTRPAAVAESPMFLRVAITLPTLALFAAPITAGLLPSTATGDPCSTRAVPPA
ncbi:hypothetical protein [Sphaerisporangium sp. NPDC051011]|uniref:hypothetical protein n=1 Tax=Sphaerisporangium sp. NPDC051011 TaxID=3155792 RepID=UPI0033C4BE44